MPVVRHRPHDTLRRILHPASEQRATVLTWGACVGVAVFLKIWPLALIPVLVARRAWRALATAACTITVGSCAWLWWSGVSGFRQVLTFRGARGWHAESVPGLLLGIVTHAHGHIENGNFRI